MRHRARAKWPELLAVQDQVDLRFGRALLTVITPPVVVMGGERIHRGHAARAI